MPLNIQYANPGLPVTYFLDSDPLLFNWRGTNAELNSILYRTDVPEIYYKSGPNADQWTVLAAASPSAAGTGLFFWGCDDIAAAAGTTFLSPGYAAASVATDIKGLPVPPMGSGNVRATSLIVRHNLANGNGQIVDYTLMVNGVNSNLVVALATGATGEATDTDSVSLSSGDRLSLRAVKTNAIGSGVLNVVASVFLEPV